MRRLKVCKNKGLKKLILDLRGNGGGVLDEATAIADEFLEGDKLITYTEGKHFPKREYRCQREGLFEKGELVVLADEGTASASEVLMGALQDWDRATIIGRRSFGKGLVQEQYDLSDGSALTLNRCTGIIHLSAEASSVLTPMVKRHIMKRSTTVFMMEKFEAADSVKMIHTKVYTTKNGKKVYGGGGITPDIFIPVDTAYL